MMRQGGYDAVVVGAGPNGLAAAITLAQAGRSVLVREARETVGGGMRSAELTLPGFVHDICAAAHPLGVGSPFFRTLPLAERGLAWVHSPAPLAHPLDDGTAVVLERSVRETAENLGRDGARYRALMGPLVADWEKLAPELLSPLPLPKNPLALARFGALALLPARVLAQVAFREKRARALFAGMAGHSMLPLERVITASFGLVLGVTAHALGWPVARGGSQAIADALTSHLKSLGGTIETGEAVKTLDELPPARTIMLDVTPRQVLQLAGDRLPTRYQQQLRGFRYGPGVYKMDWALDGPVPWRAAECGRAATVHVGGAVEEIARAERDAWRGRHSERPFVLVVQPSLADPTRAPAGKQTLWAYCHVPHGSTVNMTEAIEGQIERFAPGFRDRILARHRMTSEAMERYNANYVGGDVNGGAQDLGQLFTRPTLRFPPYSTPVKGLYICSSSTPPGGGVHGMCGYHAARAALRRGG